MDPNPKVLERVEIFLDPATGGVEFLRTAPALALAGRLAGRPRVRRASHVMPARLFPRLAFQLCRRLAGEEGKIAAWTRRWPGPWRADLRPSGGPVLGPFPARDAAIAREISWLLAHYFAG